MKPADRSHIYRTITAGLELVSDQQASEAVGLYPEMQYDGKLIKAGTRINWNRTLKRAAVDLWDLEVNSPDIAPTLWDDIAYREGVRVIPEIITATQAFALDELGWWQEKVYRSLRDGNVFNPSVTPEWWEEVNG